MTTGTGIKSLWKEPTLHFVLIGALLFGADHYFTLQQDDPRQIIIDPERVAWLVEVFKEGQGRAPTQDEIDDLIVKWSQNEVFYREARALGLDQGDEMMRSRLILKMRNILFNRLMDEPPEEQDLRDWFELNRERYDVPVRYTFEQYPIPAESIDTAQTVAQVLLDGEVPSDLQQNLRAYPRRPVKNMDALFGVEGRETLLAASIGEWVPVQSSSSWHMARVTQEHPPIPAEFEDVRSKVVRDFKDIYNDMQLTEMAAEIADKYQMHLQFDDADIEQILASAASYEPGVTTADSRSLKARAGVSRAAEEDALEDALDQSEEG